MPLAPPSIVVVGIMLEAGLLILALLLGWGFGLPPLGRMRLDLAGIGWGVGATLPLLALLWWCLRTRWSPVARLVQVVETRLGPLFADTSLLGLALVAAFAGLGEEVFFRGLLQEGLQQQLPPWAAVALAGAIFGLVHWVTPTYAVLAGLVGCYLGALFLLTGNLLAPILTHALYDLVALRALVRFSSPAPAGVAA